MSCRQSTLTQEYETKLETQKQQLTEEFETKFETQKQDSEEVKGSFSKQLEDNQISNLKSELVNVRQETELP